MFKQATYRLLNWRQCECTVISATLIVGGYIPLPIQILSKSHCLNNWIVLCYYVIMFNVQMFSIWIRFLWNQSFISYLHHFHEITVHLYFVLVHIIITYYIIMLYCYDIFKHFILYDFRKHVHALQFHESWVIIYHLYHVSLCKWTSFDLSIYHVSCSLSFICVLPQCSAAAEVWYAHIVTAKLLSCDVAQSGSLIWWPLVQELTLSSKWSSVNVCFICYIIYICILHIDNLI